jgi:hypothetical protein
MTVEINIEVFGEKIISRRLLRLGERAIDAAPAFEAIALMFYDSEKKQFASEGVWASGGWVPDKQATLNEKIRGGYSTLTLQRTGAMMHSLTEPDAPFSKKRVGPDFVEVMSTVPYGKYHQKGTTKMAMRKPVELNQATKTAMVKILQGWVLGGVAGGEEVVVGKI